MPRRASPEHGRGLSFVAGPPVAAPGVLAALQPAAGTHCTFTPDNGLVDSTTRPTTSRGMAARCSSFPLIPGSRRALGPAMRPGAGPGRRAGAGHAARRRPCASRTGRAATTTSGGGRFSARGGECNRLREIDPPVVRVRALTMSHIAVQSAARTIAEVLASISMSVARSLRTRREPASRRDHRGRRHRTRPRDRRAAGRRHRRWAASDGRTGLRAATDRTAR